MKVVGATAVGPLVTVVQHGSTAGTARPSNAQCVVWIGTVDPTNATSSDFVLRTDLSGDLSEQIRDTIATALVAGTNVTITPNDGADTITIDATGGGGGADGVAWAVYSGRLF